MCRRRVCRGRVCVERREHVCVCVCVKQFPQCQYKSATEVYTMADKWTQFKNALANSELSACAPFKSAVHQTYFSCRCKKCGLGTRLPPLLPMYTHTHSLTSMIDPHMLRTKQQSEPFGPHIQKVIIPHTSAAPLAISP